MPTPGETSEQEYDPSAGAVAHEKFVRESREMDLAWKTGRLNEWLERKVQDELRLAARPTE